MTAAPTKLMSRKLGRPRDARSILRGIPIRTFPKNNMAKVTMKKKAFEKEHKHLVKVLNKGSKHERHEEAESQAKELEEEKTKSIRGAKSEAIEDKKDNYEKKPSEKLKKKRWTSDGHMRG